MKIKIIPIAVLTAATMFASCNRNNDGDILDDKGSPTSMTVSINFPEGPKIRSTYDPNGLDAEAKVNWVDIFVYNTNTGNLLSHANLTADKFDQVAGTSVADVYQAKVKIQTTTGARSVFAGINLPAAIVENLKNQTVNALTSDAQTMSRIEQAGANNFAMFSKDAVNASFVEDENDPANHVTLKCQRLVAKVTVETSATLEIGGSPGILGDLKFAVNNFNSKVFMLQGEAPNYKDPNWNTYTSSDYSDAAATDYVEILDRKLIASPTKEDYHPRYAAENTSNGKLKKEITRATVRATFIPEVILEGSTGNFTENSIHGITTPQTFYAVTRSVDEGTQYFFDVTVANEYAAENGGSFRVVTYTDGYCYWDVFLGKNNQSLNKWDVLRNDYYQCNITRIVAPGRETPDLTDPDNTPDTDTKITADIEILFWNTPILSDYILE